MEDKMAQFYVWMMSVPVFHTGHMVERVRTGVNIFVNVYTSSKLLNSHRNEGAGYLII